jgi:hypothetical protein
MNQQVKWLLAWLEEPEAITSLLGHAAAEEEQIDEPKRAWQAAREALARRPPFSQHKPRTLELPAELEEKVKVFKERPDVISAMHGLEWDLAMVDLQNVLSFQKVVAEEDAVKRAENLVADDLNSLFSFCLPDRGGTIKIAGSLDQDNKAVTFSSLNPNLRVGGQLIVDLDVSPGPGLPAKKEKVVGFIVNFGVPFVQVAEYNGRWFLRDGYHRCYGLLKRSINVIPCIFVKARTFNEIGAVGGGFFSYEVLFGDHPPLVSDFLDDSVAKTASRLAQRKVVRVSASEFVVQL